MVDNGKVMIPDGADATAMKYILPDINKNSIGGVKGAMKLLTEL